MPIHMRNQSGNIEGQSMENNEVVLKKITVVWTDSTKHKEKTLDCWLVSNDTGGITVRKDEIYMFIPYHAFRYYYHG